MRKVFLALYGLLIFVPFALLVVACGRAALSGAFTEEIATTFLRPFQSTFGLFPDGLLIHTLFEAPALGAHRYPLRMLTIRRMTHDDIDAAADLTARVFADDAEEQRGMNALMRAAYQSCPFIPPELCWIGVEDERLVVKWQLLDFQVRIAGAVIPIAGIGSTTKRRISSTSNGCSRRGWTARPRETFKAPRWR